MATINANGYTNRSNANRAAKAAGLVGFSIMAKGGKFFVVEAADATPAVATPATPAAAPAKAAKKAPVKAPKAKATKPPKAKPKAKAKAAPVAQGEILRESSVEHPVKMVWHIADSMKGAKRKDVLAACEAKGIAFYTARTQYQLWKATLKASTKK